MRGSSGKEMQITIKSVGCKHRCKFCGLCLVDKEYKKPLSREEFISQLTWALTKLEAELAGIKKVSIIGNAHSTFTDDVITKKALKEGIQSLADKLSSLTELGFEAHGKYITDKNLRELNQSVPAKIEKEMGLGVESGIESVRRATGKNLSDKQIFDAAEKLLKAGWALRAYFIYNLPSRGHETASKDFEKMALFLATIKKLFPELRITLYANRGYRPENIKNNPAFKDFVIASEKETMRDTISVAKICKDADIVLDVDVTLSDEAMLNAKALKITTSFQKAFDDFNSTQDIAALKEYLEWKKR